MVSSSFLYRPTSSWTRRNKISKQPQRRYTADGGCGSLQSLTEQGKFDTFLKRLKAMDNESFVLEHQSAAGLFINQGQEENSNSKTCSSSILHVALANRAQLCVVETLLDRIKECCAVAGHSIVVVAPEEIQDASGRTPLHVATENGCNVNVIERLLSGETLITPAYTKDKLGRFPLHWACCCLPHESSSKEIRQETIHLLLNAYPMAVLVPDIYGMTPLDYSAQSSIHLDPHTMQALVRVAKAHKFLEKASTFVSNTMFTTASKEGFSSAVSSPNSSETTEQENTDNDDDDEEEESVGSLRLPQGTLTFGEMILLLLKQ